MCLSGRCSMCQHDAIAAGINHHDLYAVVEYQRNTYDIEISSKEKEQSEPKDQEK